MVHDSVFGLIVRHGLAVLSGKEVGYRPGCDRVPIAVPMAVVRKVERPVVHLPVRQEMLMKIKKGQTVPRRDLSGQSVQLQRRRGACL